MTKNYIIALPLYYLKKLKESKIQHWGGRNKYYKFIIESKFIQTKYNGSIIT